MSRPEGIPPCPRGARDEDHEIAFLVDGWLSGPRIPRQFACVSGETLREDLPPGYVFEPIFPSPKKEVQG